MDDKITQKIKELVKKYPNDGDLGKEVRKIIISEEKKSETQKTEQEWELSNGY